MSDPDPFPPPTPASPWPPPAGQTPVDTARPDRLHPDGLDAEFDHHLAGPEWLDHERAEEARTEALYRDYDNDIGSDLDENGHYTAAVAGLGFNDWLARREATAAHHSTGTAAPGDHRFGYQYWLNLDARGQRPYQPGDHLTQVWQGVMRLAAAATATEVAEAVFDHHTRPSRPAGCPAMSQGDVVVVAGVTLTAGDTGFVPVTVTDHDRSRGCGCGSDPVDSPQPRIRSNVARRPRRPGPSSGRSL